MMFQCDQGHKFHYPQKHIVNSTNQNSTPISYPTVANETMVCPICQSLSFSEFIEPTENIEKVYIYDLTSGYQTELSRLLNEEGFKIVARYAKQYHLEKPKVAVPKNPDPDDNQAFIEQVESAYKLIPEKAQA